MQDKEENSKKGGENQREGEEIGGEAEIQG